MKYTYRAFAKLTATTIRTLRYYEKLGLIKPIVERSMKYIQDSYLIKMQAIFLLKKSGYTLEKIKYILEDKNIEEQIILQKDVLNVQLTNTQTMLTLINTLQEKKEMDFNSIYKTFLQIQNQQSLQLQFDTLEGLQTRISFHHKHTHFQENFQQWMFQHYQFKHHDKILEIGCGDGTLWAYNVEKIPIDVKITLCDISQNMVDECQNRLKGITQIKNIEYGDCFQLPYENESFDTVIINHVLMYFENLDTALQEIFRVLKKGGVLYCSTIAKDMMKERDELLKRFDAKISFDQAILNQRFGYENGKKKLTKYFNHIQFFDRKEVYKIGDVSLYYRFIMSAKGLSQNLEHLYSNKTSFYEFLESTFQTEKMFALTIHAGMFTAIKPKEVSNE